jgi:hypothetical protein
MAQGLTPMMKAIASAAAISGDFSPAGRIPMRNPFGVAAGAYRAVRFPGRSYLRANTPA